MIEITSAILFVYSSLYGGPATINQNPTTSTSSPVVAIVEESEVEIPNNVGLNKLVREYFTDTPLLAEIAKCESSFRQYDKDGEVLRGRVNGSDVGLMQVNEYYHGESAKKLGFDIYSVEGNLAYAKWLYNREGGQPWKASSPCWGKTNASAQVAVAR
jgi:hypothetical protein